MGSAAGDPGLDRSRRPLSEGARVGRRMAGTDLDRQSACEPGVSDARRRDERIPADISRAAAVAARDQTTSLRHRIRDAAQDVAGYEKPSSLGFSLRGLLPRLATDGRRDL